MKLSGCTKDLNLKIQLLKLQIHTFVALTANMQQCCTFQVHLYFIGQCALNEYICSYVIQGKAL